MSDSLYPSMNGTDPVARLEAQLVATARALPYPPTPDLAALIRTRLPATAGAPALPRRMPARQPVLAPRRLPWAVAAAVAVLLLSLLAVPSVRSGVIDFLRLGAVRFQFGPTATPTPAPTPTGTLPAASATPQPTPTPLASVLDLAGQTTLEQARARLSFSIRLPTYPADLGEPDQVFVQDLDGQAVVLVWLVPGQTGQVRLSLHILTSDVMAEKLIKTSPTIEFTHVNGREAVWTSGPYFVVSRNGNFTQMRLITGHVLIWTDKSLTYRLETDATVEEAVKMAESLK